MGKSLKEIHRTSAKETRRTTTMMGIDWSQLVPEADIRGDSPEDTRLLKRMVREAHDYLGSFKWCRAIVEGFYGLGIGGVVGVILFKITPASPDIDSCLWVVVGDLPPAYLVVDESPTPSEALKRYVAEMRRWISAVRRRASLKDCIPVNAEPTLENAKLLEKRLDLLLALVVDRYHIRLGRKGRRSAR